MAALTPTVVLTAEQIEFYHREGYLVVPHIMPADEVEKMRIIYDRLFESQAGRKSGDFLTWAGATTTTSRKSPR